MKYSADRMEFIIDYMSAYKQKIEMANKMGLLDSAKMFELFAEEICKLYYGVNFHNLNESTCNFPYFDLISDDERILVQVSTVSDVHQKIKKTLENIRDDKKNRFAKINSVYFFVLQNDSIKNIKDYTGANQIGNISFIKENNLITTQDIINKAQNDLIFQEKLYSLIKIEFESFNEWARKLEDALDNSKNIGISNIETKINDEYVIDRHELIEKMRKDNAKFISVQGREGVGKTVICKKFIEDENMVLYARAERFLEETHLEKIWNLDIRRILECLNGKKIIFFIDALEFIADASKTKFDLLESLYNVVQKYENAYIITSCRTSDKNAFIKIESKYNIVDYDVNEINECELKDLEKQYPLIKKMSQDKKYESLLKTPFYINIMIKNSVDIDNITDINKFREYIWNNIICLKNNENKYKINLKDIEDAINKIVFDRAQKFTLGIKETDIDSRILNVLETEGIITYNNEGIRLKYDIYEDICFENFFDNTYCDCKGKYQDFYKNIEKIGRCVYRRYQIWIANKLLAKENRDKFIYNLIFDNEISEEWKKQTEIGIVKSNYSNSFFEENEMEILEKGLLLEFIDIINLYSYDAKIVNYEDFSDVQLIPVGAGRENIISIVEKNNIYCKNIINKNKIVKLCLDYIEQRKQKESITKKICTIMQFYIEESFKEETFNILDEINKCLIVTFKLSNYCKAWLNTFFGKIIEYYNGTDTKKRRIAKKIIEFTIKNSWPQLTVDFPEKLCDMASMIWKKEKEDNRFYYIEDNPYGLRDDYDHLYPNVKNNIFLWNIFRNNFWKGLDWAIKFVNECVEKYARNYPENLMKIKLIFIDENNIQREYYGNPNIWMGCTEDHHVHNLLSDIVYNIKETMINYIDKNICDKDTLKFLEYIRSKIYKESNNILLLTVVESIGMHYQNEFPGYALDLISSIDIVEWDISRYATYLSNPQLEMLKKQIFQKVGIPGIKNRYSKDSKCNISIEQYAQNIQINGDSKIIEKCYKILDYLYSIVNNDEENASKYLQIQKMDFRNAKLTQLDNNIISIEANITGEAKKVVERHKENKLLSDDLILKLNQCNEDLKEKKDCSQLLVNLIDEFISFKNNNDIRALGLERIIIGMISTIFQKDNVSIEKKNDYCIFWIEGIEQILKNQSFEFEPHLISKLIEQLYVDIPVKTKNRIRLIVLKFVNESGYDGIINSIKEEIIKYLRKDSELSNSIFNTIIELSKDEMEHQKFNATYIKQRNKDFKFVPNKIPRLKGVDIQVKQEKEKKYKSHRIGIIENYLYSMKKLNITEFNITNYDLNSLCCIANCGKNFNDNLFCKIIKEIIRLIIDIKNDYSNEYKNDILDMYQEHEIIRLFERELAYMDKDYEKIIDIMFDDVDFSELKKEAIEFYLEILNCFIALYCNSYNDKNMRAMIKRKIKYIEKKVKDIKLEYVKQELSKCLYLSPGRFDKWNPYEIKTKYEYKDKKFLNEQLCEYGKYDIENSMRTIYLLKIDELLPEILTSLEEILKFNKEILERNFEGDTKIIIDRIITKAFINFSDDIKKESDLIEAYEKILKILIELNYEKAGVILDEFRIH
ncbi:MAG: SMEK domain-containing protein [Clostridium sp.]|nr:SMEK domain-containing protein [Clostridium sp.]